MSRQGYASQLSPLRQSGNNSGQLFDSPRGSPDLVKMAPRTLEPLVLDSARHPIPKKALEEMSRYSKGSHMSRTQM